MAREKNKIETIQITLSVTEQIRDMLEVLSSSGFFGKNSADTATILLRERLRDIYQNGAPGIPPLMARASAAVPANPAGSSGQYGPGPLPAPIF